MFLLSELSHLPIKVGLYRDDLLSVSSLGARQVEKVCQQMREIFRRHGSGLKIEANMQTTDFLDVFLDLKAGHTGRGSSQSKSSTMCTGSPTTLPTS